MSPVAPATARRRPVPGPGVARYASPLGVAAVCLVLAALADALLRHEHGANADERFYVQMAAHPGRPHTFPFAYRIAVPWLVHLLPFSRVASFQLIALLSIAAAGAVLFLLLRDFGVATPLAIGLAVGFALSPNFLVALLRHGQSVDPASTLIMVLGCRFIVRRQAGALALTLVVGVAVKETSLFLIPLAYAVWAQRLVDRRALRDVALIAAGPVAVYLLIRAVVPAIGSQYTPGYTGSFLSARAHVFRQVFTGAQLRRIAYAFGPLWLVAPFALRDLAFARRGLVLIALCVVGMSVAEDAGRDIFIAAPVVYVAAAFVVQRRRRLALLLVVALLALDVGYAVYMQAYGVAHGLDVAPSNSIPAA
jgi:hypothetical protein